jgi:aminoglycoside phosphotransferase (APT) family kinase protein
MNQPSRSQTVNPQNVEAVVKQLFPAEDTQAERVLSGISTYVYRISSQSQTYYLRILPEEGASLTPEIAVLTWLRQNNINVPAVIYFEEYNEALGRPIMIEAEIKGLALSRSYLPRASFERIALEAGRDLARINNLTVEGFGWVKPNQTYADHLSAMWPTWRSFVLQYREADLAYLSQHVLDAQEMRELERVLATYDSWLDIEQGYLAHGDFDTTHIFHDQEAYTGIIDFGEVRSASRWYDLAHFRIRDGALPPYRLFAALERGYQEIDPFPAEYAQQLRFTSVLINIRALSRAFQTRPPDEYIWRQLAVLHEDLAELN